MPCGTNERDAQLAIRPLIIGGFLILLALRVVNDSKTKGAPIRSTPASENYRIRLEKIAEFKSKTARLSRVAADQDRSPA